MKMVKLYLASIVNIMFLSIVKFYVFPEQNFKKYFPLAHFEVVIYVFFLFCVPIVAKYVMPTSIKLNFASLF